MRTIHRLPLLLSMLVPSMFTAPCQGAQGKGVLEAPAGPVELQRQPDVIRGVVEAFPHLVAGPAVTATSAEKINAALVRADGRVKSAALDCQASFKEQQHKTSRDAWQRTITVSMLGPHFVSFTALDSYYCGGPYPNDGLEMPLVYDLVTGSPVNWVKLLPAGTKGVLSNGADGTKTGEIVWPAIRKVAMRDADADCKEAWDSYPEMTFSISLDAKQGAVVLQPTSFPHAMQACADDVLLDAARLRALKAAPELIEAVEAAHRLQASQPPSSSK